MTILNNFAVFGCSPSKNDCWRCRLNNEFDGQLNRVVYNDLCGITEIEKSSSDLILCILLYLINNTQIRSKLSRHGFAYEFWISENLMLLYAFCESEKKNIKQKNRTKKHNALRYKQTLFAWYNNQRQRQNNNKKKPKMRLPGFKKVTHKTYI